jgi:translation initiation factor 1 (eIF-1/SUI1)
MTTLELTALPTIREDTKAFITKCSKKFCVGGSYDNKENAIKFSGDIRDGLAEMLIAEKLTEKDKIKIHGF